MHLPDAMNDIFERIRSNNPWWKSVSAIGDDPLLLELAGKRYQYFHPLISTLPLNKDGVMTIRGPRRVGKSTLLRLIIKKLLQKEKTPKEAVFSFACDRITDYNELFAVIKTYLDFARPRTNSRLFIFLDEISFVKNWQLAIKEMVDAGLLKNSLMILSGSSILDLRYAEGIFPNIFYYPLSFGEFVNIIDPSLISNSEVLSLTYRLPKLSKLFDDYLLTGGFMKIINEYFATGRITNGSYETLLTAFENDINKIGRNGTTAYQIVSNLIRTMTTPVSQNELAKSSGLVSHEAVGEYLDIFEKMFTTTSFPAYLVEQRRKDLLKNKKYYFVDPFIFNALFAKVKDKMDDPFGFSRDVTGGEKRPLIAENVVAAHLFRNNLLHYWGKTANGEIDFVTKTKDKLSFYEVKYREKIDYSEILKVDNLTIISKKTYKEKPILTLPLEIFLLI